MVQIVQRIALAFICHWSDWASMGCAGSTSDSLLNLKT